MQRTVALDNDKPDGSSTTMYSLADTLTELLEEPPSSDDSFHSYKRDKSETATECFSLGSDVDINTISDFDLVRIAYEKSAPTLSWTEDKHVVRVSRNHVLKYGKGVLESEAKALKIASVEYGLNCPKVHRAFSLDEERSHFGTCGYILMDYISGESLNDNWLFFPQREQANIARQIAEAIQKMQSVSIKSPGPIGGGPYRGTFFSKPGVAAFASLSEMESWFEQKLAMSKRLHQCPQDLPPMFRFNEFVLVHQNLSPDNIMIDETGTAWIVGWSNAGAYPPAFERAAVAAQDNCKEFRNMMLQMLPERGVEEKQLAGLRFAVNAADY